MYSDSKIYIGLSDDHLKICMDPAIANRHGLITGTTGTGKTITMKVLAESFSQAGVPVFVCDMKGDVSGLAQKGTPGPDMEKRIEKFGLQEVFEYKGFPCVFWDIFAKKGHPVRITVSDLGPELLSRLLELSTAQSGVLDILFQAADDSGLILDDLKDLEAMLDLMSEKRAEFAKKYGAVSAQSLAGIRRALLPLKKSGSSLFGRPALDLQDWIRTVDGMGVINILDCTALSMQPLLYSAFLLWLMSELYETLPECGDLPKPKLVLFFDEAHLIFQDAPKALVSKIEQIIRLIRSKGVGIYFVSQSPSDLPATVLSQLNNRFQHALHAYTPLEQKALKAAANSLRPNPDFDTLEVITALKTGQALVSVLDESGSPMITQKTSIICPCSLMGPVDEGLRREIMAADGMSRYDQEIDEESAFELLSKQKEEEVKKQELEEQRKQLEKEKAEFEAQKKKEALALEKKKAKEAEAAQKKAQRQAEKEAERKEREKERRKAQIEKQLFNTTGTILRRSILNTLKKFGK